MDKQATLVVYMKEHRASGNRGISNRATAVALDTCRIERIQGINQAIRNLVGVAVPKSKNDQQPIQKIPKPIKPSYVSTEMVLQVCDKKNLPTFPCLSLNFSCTERPEWPAALFHLPSTTETMPYCLSSGLESLPEIL